jgi:hypothetical protein
MGDHLSREVLATVSDELDMGLTGEVQQKKEIETAVTEGLPGLLIVALGKSDSLPEVYYRIPEKLFHCAGPGEYHAFGGPPSTLVPAGS